ncbi:hypothetical protein D9758_017352 [Tetrapyrgos nigripes]|uniref:Uncharacterized protein n=1 Tax=Tetrapyrgos nigripes TaxID=182062 RepID=A0A8H5C498_9AGAR|nr:hypothetical protein D9758_017352 [Tetrapyrgos nigripes]
MTLGTCHCTHRSARRRIIPPGAHRAKLGLLTPPVTDSEIRVSVFTLRTYALSKHHLGKELEMPLTVRMLGRARRKVIVLLSFRGAILAVVKFMTVNFDGLARVDWGRRSRWLSVNSDGLTLFAYTQNMPASKMLKTWRDYRGKDFAKVRKLNGKNNVIYHKLHVRASIATIMIQIMHERKDEDAERAWRYVLLCIEKLGYDGMSDEEDGELLYESGQRIKARRVKKLQWRRPYFRGLLEKVDKTWQAEFSIFSQQGRSPLPRLRVDDRSPNIFQNLSLNRDI